MLGKPPDTVPSMLKVKSEGFQDCSMKRKIMSSEHTLEKPAKRIKLAPLPSEEGEMKVGDYVRVTQVCQMQYENARGKLIEYLPNKGKWRVDLFDFSKILRIKTHNLRKIEEIRLLPPSVT
jgi:transcription antitermination factor NusG